MNLEEIKKQYIYIVMRTGSVKEIPARGRTTKQLVAALKGEKLLYFDDLEIGINEMDVSEVLTVEQYANYINTRRPKTFIRKGKIKTLKKEEVFAEKFLKAIETEKLEKINQEEVQKILPYKN